MALSETAPGTDAPSTKLVPIMVDTLCPTEVLDFDLYIEREPSEPVILYRQRRLPLKQEDLDRLSARGIRTLFTQWDDHEAYRQLLTEKVVNNEELPPVQRHQALKEANRAVFEDTYRNGSVQEMVEFTGGFASQMIDIVCNQDLIVGDLYSLMDHDYQTYSHVTNVGTYALVLADGLTISCKEELLAIATGALLHDIGKRKIELDILNKPGPLNRLVSYCCCTESRHCGIGSWRL